MQIKTSPSMCVMRTTRVSGSNPVDALGLILIGKSIFLRTGVFKEHIQVYYLIIKLDLIFLPNFYCFKRTFSTRAVCQQKMLICAETVS